MAVVSVDVLHTDTSAVDDNECQPVLKRSTTDHGYSEYIYIWLII